MKNKSCAYRISFIKPSLTLFVTTYTTIANKDGDNTGLWCAQTFTGIGNCSKNFVPTLTFANFHFTF